ncbi:hypothetical protein GZH46_01627, partial [Fragariocoptes setiger]
YPPPPPPKTMTRKLIASFVAISALLASLSYQPVNAIKRDERDYSSSAQVGGSQQQSGSSSPVYSSSVPLSASSGAPSAPSSSLSSSSSVASSVSASPSSPVSGATNHQSASSGSSASSPGSVTFSNQPYQPWRDINQLVGANGGGQSSSYSGGSSHGNNYYGADQATSASSQSNSYEQAAASVNQALSSSGLLAAQGASYGPQSSAGSGVGTQSGSGQTSNGGSLFYYYYPPSGNKDQSGQHGASVQPQQSPKFNNDYGQSYGSQSAYGGQDVPGLQHTSNSPNGAGMLEASASHPDPSYASANPGDSQYGPTPSQQNGPAGPQSQNSLSSLQDYQPQSQQPHSGIQNQPPQGPMNGVGPSGYNPSNSPADLPNGGYSQGPSSLNGGLGVGHNGGQSSFGLSPHQSQSSSQQQPHTNGYPSNGPVNDMSAMQSLTNGLTTSQANAVFGDLTPSFNSMPTSYVSSPGSSESAFGSGSNGGQFNPFATSQSGSGSGSNSPFGNFNPGLGSGSFMSSNPFQGPHHQGHSVSFEPTTSPSNTNYNRRYGLGSFIMPMLALAGLSLLIPTMSNIVPSVGRKKRSVGSMGGQNEQQAAKETAISEYIDRIERYYSIYKSAVENDDCLNRLICELGDAVREVRGKSAVVTVIEKVVPTWMVGKMHVFKESALSSDKEKCKKYVCNHLHK